MALNYPELNKKYNATLERNPDIALVYSLLVDSEHPDLSDYSCVQIFRDAVCMVRSGYKVNLNLTEKQVIKAWILWSTGDLNL